MKYLLLLCYCILTACVMAAGIAAEPIIYMDVLRDASGRPMPHQSVKVTATIHESKPTGHVIFSEVYTLETSYKGMYSLSIGSGMVQYGSIDSICPDRGYYITISTDTGMPEQTTQMLHIPYTCYVTNGKLTAGALRPGYRHYIGELYGGGVIADLWKEDKGGEHGIIVAPGDVSDSLPWCQATTKAIGRAAESVADGPADSKATAALYPHSAAALCSSYSGGGYHDWYLPSIAELNIIYGNMRWMRTALGAHGVIRDFLYWSATEYDAGGSWAFGRYGQPSNDYVYSKYAGLHVRPVRRF
ncbi:MAG: DUF1566 domain-containing protein [Bacteroidetes bacterium]|nr:DUF1566 domain-containing protein [Bacteroidota bacterium]